VAGRSPALALPFHAHFGVRINAVEGFFSNITRRRIRRGVFHSGPDLQDVIARTIRDHYRAVRPFVWTKPAEAVLAELAKLPASSE
jgi:hypothetical protein